MYRRYVCIDVDADVHVACAHIWSIRLLTYTQSIYRQQAEQQPCSAQFFQNHSVSALQEEGGEEYAECMHTSYMRQS